MFLLAGVLRDEMELETLEAKIKERANQDVQASIGAFRTTIRTALHKLLGFEIMTYDGNKLRRVGDCSPNPEIDGILAGLARGANDCWPQRLWAEAEERIKADVLSTMDTLQRVLASKPSTPDDAVPAPAKEGAKA